jgi:cell division protein FtsB
MAQTEDIQQENTDKPKPKPKKSKKQKRLNRWSVFGLLVLAAILIVIYINNVMRIEDLLFENQNLKKQYSELKYKNETLVAKVNALESPENIIPKATEKLKMLMPEEAPELIK